MKTLEIKGTLREGTGKRASHKLRKQGNVPCVIYGPEQNTHFYAHENSFLDLVYTHETHLVKLNIDGREVKSFDFPAGSSKMDIEASDLAAGTYILESVTAGFRQTDKVQIIK